MGASVIIKQRDLFTRKWRMVRAPEPLEFQIQAALVAHLKLLGRPGIIYFAVPNGELRDDRTAAKLKAMGVRPGVADMIFIWSDAPAVARVLCLELKRRGEKQSATQQQFQLDCGLVCADYEVADSIDAALKILEHYGLLRGRG